MTQSTSVTLCMISVTKFPVPKVKRERNLLNRVKLWDNGTHKSPYFSSNWILEVLDSVERRKLETPCTLEVTTTLPTSVTPKFSHVLKFH